MGIEIELSSNIPQVMAQLDGHAKEKMTEAVEAVRGQVLETLSGQRSGRQYRVPGTRVFYTASSPGEPPAQATGRLRQSIKTSIDLDGVKVMGAVGSDIIYAPCLEYGTSKMAARPWLKKSFDESIDKIKEIFTRKWF